MSVLWTTPMALLGIGLIALPIAVHLLVRHQIRTLVYPSLRFLRETQLAAFRRRRIEDALLLACRCAIVGIAAVALAGPVVQSAARSAEQARRVSRAIITTGAVAPDAVTRLGGGAFASARIERASLADGVRDALRWLDAQPRSAGEIVFVGEWRRGVIGRVDLAPIPQAVGIRFEQTASDLSAELTVPVLARRQDRLVRIAQAVTAAADATRVSTGVISQVPDDLVSIVARQVDTPLAEAALRAALDAGVPWRDFDRRVLISWEGADEAAVKARSSGAEVVRMRVPQPAASAADAVRSALVQASGVRWTEPIALTSRQLEAWSRPAGPPASNAPVIDEGDRRWLWALVLVLLALEWRLRRSVATPAVSTQEARVA